ncbi:hypothetical protein NPIL_406691 [Nephila pilipes]|uniref:Uncharacterized protein n=1 Tax=Nephila pilipes TaxID=299642 RepID=A0A8X6T6D0_NEPPI|nr:hypothetical protein NPIL_406691 [Nephila pilipes]
MDGTERLVKRNLHKQIMYAMYANDEKIKGKGTAQAGVSTSLIQCELEILSSVGETFLPEGRKLWTTEGSSNLGSSAHGMS